jgi:hypothetical protein
MNYRFLYISQNHEHDQGIYSEEEGIFTTLPASILFFDPEDGGDIIFRNVGSFSTNYRSSIPED